MFIYFEIYLFSQKIKTKLAGATYMEVHEAGGGINYTVEHTKKANEEELYTLLVDRLRRMIKSGKLGTNKKNYVQYHQITKRQTIFYTLLFLDP